MKQWFFALALCIPLATASYSQAEPVQVGDTSIEMRTPTGFSEDRDTLATMHLPNAVPQKLYKVYVPKGGYGDHDGVIALEDFVAIATSETTPAPTAGTDNLSPLEDRLDRDFREIRSGETNKTVPLDDRFFDQLKSLRRKDKLLIEKSMGKGRLTYIYISRVTKAHEDAKPDTTHMVSATTFLPVRGKMLNILSFSHVKQEDVALSVRKVKYMYSNIIPMLQDNN